MLISPGGQKIIRKVDFMTLVERDDLLDAVFVSISLGDHGMGSKLEALRCQNQVVRHEPRGGQVFLHQGRGHRQGLARVIKARFVCGIDGKLPRRPNIDSRQIANGIVVFGVAETSCQNGPWITGIASGFIFANGPHPIDHGLSL